MGSKLRAKDYRTGYNQGYKDAMEIAMKIVEREIDMHNERVSNDKERSLLTVS